MTSTSIELFDLALATGKEIKVTQGFGVQYARPIVRTTAGLTFRTRGDGKTVTLAFTADAVIAIAGTH